MRGKLIVITGIDGSGKTVQTKLLCEHLLKERYPAVVTDFPQYGKTFFADMVTRYLTGEFGSANTVSPYLAAILYAGDRWECKEQIETWLNEGKIIVSNRYVSDNKAHQGGKLSSFQEREKFFLWLDTLEHHIFRIPRSDLNILLYVPADIAYKLIERKEQRAYLGTEKKDIHEKDINHLKNSQQTFLDIAKAEKHWVVINCTQNDALLPEQIIAGKVWEAVQNIIL